MSLVGRGSAEQGELAGRTGQVLNVINDSTKWIVSSLVFAVLVWNPNFKSAWWVSGAIINSFVCKTLKLVINETRPESSRRREPGMPSSHANSLAFLSIFSALALYSERSIPGTTVVAATIVASAMFLSWLRVALGDHTTAQVLAGFALGSSLAAAWWGIGTATAYPLLTSSPNLRLLLCAVTVVAIGLFAGANLAPKVLAVLGMSGGSKEA
ncbi:unnamed protein product [Ostreobium quekettii]|uniref:Phosphatidic acid phosphatase type 2/haloperoxidase domain-containing protein n=1 Tax=Ostreobium quekettii TaxID=121088 RepID=A0A8S1J274_9CHLO|nr:unnamed protein product [Ostreobium quekettii]